MTSYSLRAIVVARSKALKNERLFQLLDRYREHPDTDGPEPHADPIAEDFFVLIDEHAPSIFGLDIGLSGSTDRGSEQTLFMPEGLGFLDLSIVTHSLEGLPDHHELFLDAIRTAFEVLDAVYAVTLHEITLSVERMEWEEFRTKLGGVHMFSRGLVDVVGRERLIPVAPMHGDLAGGGVWLRFGEEYVYGMPEEYMPAMSELLEEVWQKVNLVHLVKKDTVEKGSI